jgi:hypothetical protein
VLRKRESCHKVRRERERPYIDEMDESAERRRRGVGEGEHVFRDALRR